MKSATKIKPTQTNPFTQKIVEVEAEIQNLKVEIEATEKQVNEGREAIALIKNPPKWGIPQGQFQIFEQMQEVLNQAESEELRLQKLTALEGALKTGQAMLDDKRSQLSQLQLKVEHLDSELDWLENFEPYTKAFGDSYTMPESQLKAITQAKRNLEYANTQLREFEAIAAKGFDARVDWEKQNSQRGTLPEMIAQWKIHAADHEIELVSIQAIDEADFRQYIKARVGVDESFQSLLKAQKIYLDALQLFTHQLEQFGKVLGVEASTFEFQLPIASDDSGRISISHQNL